MNRHISKEKMIRYLKEAKIDTANAVNDHHYMYGIGRNTLADLIVAGIYFGDFDE